MDNEAGVKITGVVAGAEAIMVGRWLLSGPQRIVSFPLSIKLIMRATILTNQRCLERLNNSKVSSSNK